MAAIPQNLGVPSGTIMWSASPEVPVGWLLCDGRSVTVDSYPDLYVHIGNTYGGDGITFGLPDLVGRFILGVGDPGRQPFTYGDGVNELHTHGMFPNQTHTHGVNDPEHEHPTSSGSHVHTTTSDHAHECSSLHLHSTSWGGPGSPYEKGFVTHDYWFVKGDCTRETYAPITGDYPHCSRDRFTDFFVTVLLDSPDPFFTNPLGKTGITMVNPSVTGTTVEVAFTGVTLEQQFTGVTLEPALSNMSVGDFGVPLGPQAKNLALLPIIRT